MQNIQSSITISQKISEEFTEYTQDTYQEFIEFIKLYYTSRELPYADLDFCSNLLNYYNVSNYTLSALVEYVSTIEIINSTDTSILVTSTTGFPNSGFLKIDNEIIFYNNKSQTSFDNCVRGASAAIITNDNLEFVMSEPTVHLISKCYNIGYIFLSTILRKFTKELLVDIPNRLNENIPFNLLIPQIKDFYKTKGTTDSIRFLFKILYNDVIVKLDLYPKGFGANIKLVLQSGRIVGASIIDGGEDYTNIDIASYPNIYVVGGGGYGAVLRITSIDITGSITSIEIVNSGAGYGNNTYAVVEEQDFRLNFQVIGTKTFTRGVVRYYNPDDNKLDLYNVIGKFAVGEYIINENITLGRIKDIHLIQLEPSVEFPYHNTLTSSNLISSNSNEILLEYTGIYITNIKRDLLNFSQKSLQQKKLSNIPESIVEIDYINLIYESSDKLIFSVISSECLSKFYSPPYSKLLSISNDEIVVDSTIGFPLFNGLIYINGEYIKYANKTIDRLYNLTRDISININDKYCEFIDNNIVYLVGNCTSQSYELFGSVIQAPNNNYNCRVISVCKQPVIEESGSNYHPTNYFGTVMDSVYNEVLTQELNLYNPNLYTKDNFVYICSDGIPKYTHNNNRTYTKQTLLKRTSYE